MLPGPRQVAPQPAGGGRVKVPLVAGKGQIGAHQVKVAAGRHLAEAMPAKIPHWPDEIGPGPLDRGHHVAHVEEVVLLGAALVEEDLDVGVEGEGVVEVAQHIEAAALEQGVDRDGTDFVIPAPGPGQPGVDPARRQFPQFVH